MGFGLSPGWRIATGNRSRHWSGFTNCCYNWVTWIEKSEHVRGIRFNVSRERSKSAWKCTQKPKAQNRIHSVLPILSLSLFPFCFGSWNLHTRVPYSVTNVSKWKTFVLWPLFAKGRTRWREKKRKVVIESQSVGLWSDNYYVGLNLSCRQDRMEL